LFEEVAIMKPETSKPSNSEIYVRYGGYKLGHAKFVESVEYTTMTQLLEECARKMKFPTDLKQPLLWGLNPGVATGLLTAAQRLVKMQTEALDLFLTLSDEIKQGKPLNHEVFRKMAREVSHQWTSKHLVLPLPVRSRFAGLKPEGTRGAGAGAGRVNRKRKFDYHHEVRPRPPHPLRSILRSAVHVPFVTPS
jgi:hypothetical protein